MVITVSGSQGDQINSLYFSRGLNFQTGSGDWEEAVLFAVELDNTVTIDSTGKANFTFAIEF